MMFVLFFSILLILIPVIYLRFPVFGEAPNKLKSASFLKSKHFKNGKFYNLESTPSLSEGYSFLGVANEFFFKSKSRLRPIDIVPSIKIEIKNLNREQDILVWFGHSSYLIQIDGKRFLVDPVFSGHASPIPGFVKSFKGTDLYSVEDLPEIDYLIITHDHYDHVDYKTKIQLRSKIKFVICGLGVGSHFERWGYSSNQIIERDWDERVDLGEGFTIFTKTARHFSGRSLAKNNTLWMSFLLQTPTMKIYLGGDGGYGKHFSEIGTEFGTIDLAILDNGQYDKAWKYIHTLPKEVLQASEDLRASRVFPVHSSKFVLANHSWDEPLIEITRLNSGRAQPFPLLTPIIGEWVFLKEDKQTFSQWWIGLK